ncbi:MAG: NAD(P)-dependent oxidoreductase [Desulfobacteraceae bacterium]|nr:NAD(P)-dependent oxidoreductase [Desulfobacteraceae bacterium]
MPAAKKFIKEGYQVVAYARRPEVIEEFRAAGGQVVNNPKEVAQEVETMVILVLNDQQVIEVVTGPDGVLEGLEKGSTVICMSTINRNNLEWVAQQCADKGVELVDCPFTGGPARVETSSLTLIVAAPSNLVEKCRPVLEFLGNINHVGETQGMGQSVKHCNQLVVAVTHAAVMEAILLAKKLGLDPHMVCEIIGSGIAGSDYFRLLSKGVLDKTPSPGGLGQMAKDIGIVVNTACQLKQPLYVATAAHQYFLAAEAMGMQNLEGADLMRLVEKITEP